MSTAAPEAVRRCHHGGDVDEERSRKRRRFDSPQSSSVDSGYNSASDEDHCKASSSTASSHYEPASPQDIDPALPMGRLRRRLNSEPCASTRVRPVLSRKSAARMQPQHDRQRLDRRRSQPEFAGALPRSDRDADLEIVAAQHQIAVARQRLYGRNGVLPTKPIAKKDLGSVGPKIDRPTDVFGLFVQGCRVMDHERNLLSSLMNHSHSPHFVTAAPPPEPAAPVLEECEVEQPVHFPGLVIPVDTGNDDQDFDTFEQEPEVVNNDIECFFNLDEASTPSDGGSSNY
ncbi:hypothetical protein DV735_g5891, partial [Chaetothyriales sp. CBS 134920]